ncbi:MAG TPA: hypothetical protein VGQ86_05775 [Candidatus Limnocylindria bacterium]|jgi:hypothetical protein|nr:hypothetical protein [Candidatus Limnocylindria bacterium]
MTPSDRTIAIALAAAGAALYLIAGLGLLTDYDYDGRLAQALLRGRWWLEEAPPWLNELLPCGEGRFCVVIPPLPAVLALPLVPFMSTAAAQVVASRIAGGASAGVLYAALRAYGAPRAYAIAGAILSAFGTTLFFSSVDGRAWYAAHAASMLFLSGAFLVAARGGPGALIGSLVGVSALARLPLAAVTPLLAWLTARRSAVPYRRALLGAVLGGLPFAVLYVAYNLARWGTPLDEGYARLTEGDVFFDHGLFSIFYLPRQLYALLLAPPEFVSGTPFFLRPRWEGMSLLLTTPAFLWVFASLREVRRDKTVAVTAALVALALLPDLLYATWGFQQFGYRRSIDAQPFLIALTVMGDGLSKGVWRKTPTIPFIVVVVISVLINLYATIAITRFDYWV